VRKIILTYEGDGEIAQKLVEDSIKNKVNIKPGFFEKGDNKYVDEVAWLPGFYGPFNSDVENLVVFVKVRKTLPPEPKKLDEARGLVTADYQTYLEDKWEKQLREKYPVTVNEKVLQKLIEKQSSNK
jgi:peptidyl-prolyl cis-trans isomerase SurA